MTTTGTDIKYTPPHVSLTSSPQPHGTVPAIEGAPLPPPHTIFTTTTAAAAAVDRARPFPPPAVHLTVEHHPLQRRHPSRLVRHLPQKLIPERTLGRIAQDEEFARGGATQSVEMGGEAREGGEREAG